MEGFVSKVKIGFAGVGFMGQAAHLHNYLKNPACEVVAIAEPRRQLAEQVARAFGIPKIYHSHLELAEDPDIDAVVASQPHLLNGYITIPLLKAGKTCFVEKPMAGSLEEAEAMVQAAHDGRSRIMVGFMKRHDTGVALAKNSLDDCYCTGRIGKPGLINAYCFGGDWLRGIEKPIMTGEPVPENPGFIPRNPAWMTAPQKDTFNTYMNIFAHNINLIRYLYPGKFNVRAAVLREGLLNQCTLFESEGVLATLYGCGVQADTWVERTEVYFEQGWVRVITPCPMEKQTAACVEVYYGGQTQQTKSMRGAPQWAFQRQADHFVECLIEDLPFFADGEDCLEDMRLMEDVFRKAQWA